MTFEEKTPTLRAKFELDLGAILEKLQQEDGDWELHSFPVLADASLALVFRREERYKVLRYAWKKGEYVPTEEWNFSLEDMVLQTVFFREGKLFGILRPVDADHSFCRQLVPEAEEESDWDGYVGSYLSQTEVNAEGIIHVGLDYVQHREDYTLLRLLDTEGNLLGEASFEGAIRCAATNLDAQGNFWCTYYPSPHLLELKEDGLEEHPVMLQGMTGFCHSEDGNKLLAAFSLEDVEAVFAALKRERNSFVDPTPLRLLRKNGEEIDAESYGISTGGDKMLVRLDSTLCVFSASDL